MSTATQRPAQGAKPQQQSAASLLDQILDRPPSERLRAVGEALEKRIETVEEVLPESLKSQAARLVKRAQLTFSRKDDLHDCDPASLVRCVVEAAELGLAIDGKLAHAVAYNTNVGTKASPRWIKLAQLQLDYKGLIAVARRSGQIIDAWGDVVCDGEEFEAYRDGAKQVLRHTPAFRTGKETVVGAYAVIDFGGGRWRFEMMGEQEIDAIRQRSKAKNNGPWVTDTNQMRIKTVLRRGLKTHCDDPALGMALEYEEREFDSDGIEASRAQKRVGRSALNEVLASSAESGQRTPPKPPQEHVRDMEEHFGGATADADEPADPPNMTEIESAFAEATSEAAIAALYDSLKGPEATAVFSDAQSDEIETFKVLALQRVKGGKRQKELG